jgi:hypothetical protein
METLMIGNKDAKPLFSLLTSVAGEIGNNSYDHNLGQWPDIPGIFFAYDLNKKQIALADRGVGILETLRKVKPELKIGTMLEYEVNAQGQTIPLFLKVSAIGVDGIVLDYDMQNGMVGNY